MRARASITRWAPLALSLRAYGGWEDEDGRAMKAFPFFGGRIACIMLSEGQRDRSLIRERLLGRLLGVRYTVYTAGAESLSSLPPFREMEWGGPEIARGFALRDCWVDG